MNDFLTTKQIEKQYGIKPDTIRKAIYRGKYKTAKKQGRDWVIREKEIMNYVLKTT